MSLHYSFVISIIGALLSFSHGDLSTKEPLLTEDTPHIGPAIATMPFYHDSRTAVTFSTSPQPVALSTLIENGQEYHEEIVSIQGLITQPELHLDETELFFDFVFRLSQGSQSIIVYGRHDRTTGPPTIRTNQPIEVTGIFFREQKRNGSIVFNVLQAISVKPHPSSIPENT